MAGKTAEDQPHPLDVALGMHIRLRRKELGLSQSGLANLVGVTFQQIQKYEVGTNRVSFSRLVEIAHALACKVTDLAFGLETSQPSARTKQIALLTAPGASELLEAYSRIESAKQRKMLRNLARQIGEDHADDGTSPSRHQSRIETTGGIFD